MFLKISYNNIYLQIKSYILSCKGHQKIIKIAIILAKQNKIATKTKHEKTPLNPHKITKSFSLSVII